MGSDSLDLEGIKGNREEFWEVKLVSIFANPLKWARFLVFQNLLSLCFKCKASVTLTWKLELWSWELGCLCEVTLRSVPE